MRAVGPGSRWSRGAVTGMGLLVAGATVAACSSGGASPAQPQGLNGGASAQFSSEDKQADSVLTPQSGAFLAGKTNETLVGPTTPTSGDEVAIALAARQLVAPEVRQRHQITGARR